MLGWRRSATAARPSPRPPGFARRGPKQHMNGGGTVAPWAVASTTQAGSTQAPAPLGATHVGNWVGPHIAACGAVRSGVVSWWGLGRGPQQPGVVGTGERAAAAIRGGQQVWGPVTPRWWWWGGGSRAHQGDGHLGGLHAAQAMQLALTGGLGRGLGGSLIAGPCATAREGLGLREPFGSLVLL